MSYNTEVKAGATWPFDFTLKDKRRLPIDLTGVSARLQLRDELLDSEVVASLTGVITQPTTGNVQFTLSPEQTRNALPDGEQQINLVFDVEFTWPDGLVETYLADSSLQIFLGVTRG